MLVWGGLTPSLLIGVIAVPYLHCGTTFIFVRCGHIQTLPLTTFDSSAFNPPRLLNGVIAVPYLYFGTIIILVQCGHIQTLSSPSRARLLWRDRQTSMIVK